MGRKRAGADNPAAVAGDAEASAASSAAGGAAAIGPASSNPMIAGLSKLLGSNPQLTMNPLLIASNPLLAQSLLGNLLAASGMTNHEQEKMDPDVLELCEYFDVEERHRRNLNELMKARKQKGTFHDDMKRLWDQLMSDKATSPVGLLVAMMREMEEGTFIGKAVTDPELVALVKKFNVDETAEQKLADTLARHSEQKRKFIIAELEKHLEGAKKPSARAMMLLRKIGEGAPLGPVGPPAPGSYLDMLGKEAKGEKADDRGKKREEEQQRQRGSPDRRPLGDRDRRDDYDRRERDSDRRGDRDRKDDHRRSDRRHDRDRRSRSRSRR